MTDGTNILRKYARIILIAWFGRRRSAAFEAQLRSEAMPDITVIAGRLGPTRNSTYYLAPNVDGGKPTRQISYCGQSMEARLKRQGTAVIALRRGRDRGRNDWTVSNGGLIQNASD